MSRQEPSIDSRTKEALLSYYRQKLKEVSNLVLLQRIHSNNQQNNVRGNWNQQIETYEIKQRHKEWFYGFELENNGEYYSDGELAIDDDFYWYSIEKKVQVTNKDQYIKHQKDLWRLTYNMLFGSVRLIHKYVSYRKKIQ